MINNDYITGIRKSIEEDKLVIFVGAGVSANSNIPTWGKLIENFADALNYDNCYLCAHSDSKCPIKNCETRYKFNQDEYLKIPQFYYNADKSENHIDYKELITSTLSCDKPSNEINNIIFRLLPHHIITTNYDKLLEQSIEPNRRLYSVIREEKDLLTTINKRYIIKMHGDIDDIDNIILKEDDYLEYEHSHILTETFIKSLLIDHTFLFVGYSLNDYNLKLIISWINYLSKKHEIKIGRPQNYLIQVSPNPTREYEAEYYKVNNINIINCMDLPDTILGKHENLLLTEAGKRVYALLDYIVDESNDFMIKPLEDILYEKFSQLNGYNYIAFTDLKNVYSFGHVDLKGTTLVFHLEHEFMPIYDLCKLTSEKSRFIVGIFLKAGITAIQSEREYFQLPNINIVTIEDNLFKLYLSNSYIDLISKLSEVENSFAKAYYYHIISPFSPECENEMSSIKNHISNTPDLISLLIYKYNSKSLNQLNNIGNSSFLRNELRGIIISLPTKLKKCIKYYENLLEHNHSSEMTMSKSLIEHELMYKSSNDTLYIGNNYGNLLDIQALAYEYFFYFKFNYIMIDHFTNPKNYLEFYLKAILCTYIDRSDIKKSFFGVYNNFEKYSLNAFDIDMFIKYTKPRNLNIWLEQYKVDELMIDNDSDIVNKYVNLCNSITKFKSHAFFDYLYCFSILICKTTLSEIDVSRIINGLTSLVTELIKQDVNQIVWIYDSIYTIIINNSTKFDDGFYELLKILLNHEFNRIIQVNYSDKYQKTIRALINYKNENSEEIILENINLIKDDKEISDYIFSVRNLMDTTTLKSRIDKYLNNLTDSQIYMLVIEKVLQYDKEIIKKCRDTLDVEIIRRKANPRSITLPDVISKILERCIILHLIGTEINIRELENYVEYSDYLDFLLYPETFDYTKIDIRDYMWRNIINDDNYLPYIQFHKRIILTDSLKRHFRNGELNPDELKVLFGRLLDKEEVDKFADKSL